MQKGSLIRSSRRQGPDVWECRWRESFCGQRRKHRRVVIGTLDTLKGESAVLKAIAALRRDININDRRMRAKPLTRGTGRAPSAKRTLHRHASSRVTRDTYTQAVTPRSERPKHLCLLVPTSFRANGWKSWVLNWRPRRDL